MASSSIAFTPLEPQRLSPHNTRNNMVKFGAFGLGMRLYALGIQKRSMKSYPVVSAAFVATGAIAGYYIDAWERRAVVILADKQNDIIQARIRRADKIQAVLDAELARLQSED